jgi:uncharacterized protein DUF2017
VSESTHHGPFYVRDQLRVVAVPDGVMVDLSDDALTVFRQVLKYLVGLLERGDVLTSRRHALRLGRPASAENVLAQMFPDAYADATSATGFRQRHGPAMRAEVLAAARRLLAWDGAAPAYLSGQDVDDWLMVLGVAQFLFVSRRRWLLTSPPGAPTQRWVTYLQDQLVTALCPQLRAEVGGAFQTGP